MSATTKADEVALVLEEAIILGELAPGELLRQEQLSLEFGVSRTPVREALRQLAALGLVSLMANKGARVRSISRQDLRESFVVRAALEGYAAGLALARITTSDLRALTRAERRFAELTHRLRAADRDDPIVHALASEWMHANDSFHDVFLDASGVKRLADAARSARRVFHGQAVWTRTADLDELYELNLEQHRSIVEGFKGRTPDTRRLVEAHIFESGSLLERALDQAEAAKRTFASRVSWSTQVHGDRRRT